MSYGTTTADPDLDAIEALLAGVREDIGPDRNLWFGTFPSEVRPEHVSAEGLRLLKRYVSNRSLIVGGQSGSDRVLAHSARGHDSETVERAVALCVEEGFVPHVDFLFGMPGAGGFDLVSLNVQRGRDHGLPGYNQVRVELGRAAAVTFDDVAGDQETADRLASVYGAAKGHGGTVRVDSREGDGSTFSLWLPAWPASALAGVDAAPRAAAPLDLADRHVLVVDDE